MISIMQNTNTKMLLSSKTADVYLELIMRDRI